MQSQKLRQLVFAALNRWKRSRCCYDLSFALLPWSCQIVGETDSVPLHYSFGSKIPKWKHIHKTISDVTAVHFLYKHIHLVPTSFSYTLRGSLTYFMHSKGSLCYSRCFIVPEKGNKQNKNHISCNNVHKLRPLQIHKQSAERWDWQIH